MKSSGFNCRNREPLYPFQKERKLVAVIRCLQNHWDFRRSGLGWVSRKNMAEVAQQGSLCVCLRQESGDLEAAARTAGFKNSRQELWSQIQKPSPPQGPHPPPKLATGH